MNHRVAQKGITIVMLTHDRPDRCRDCVRHAASCMQGLRGGILVINNGRLAVNLPEKLEGVPCRVIEPGRNLGAGARNIALEATDTEYLLMLDDDAYLEPDGPGSGSLQTLIEIFSSDPGIGAVAFKISSCEGQPEACLLPTVFHGCACAFRTDALRETGGYPDNVLYYGEEYYVAFRLYQAGYRIVTSDKLKHVLHARDSAGRDINRIIRLLVRNNVSLWVSMFPRAAATRAIRDTLRRYRLVARKERAGIGFFKACSELPVTIARGWRQRRPLDDGIFRRIALIDAVETACENMSKEGKPELIICGTGKFPSFWLEVLEQQGIKTAAFWDTNPCWRGGRINGVPVLVYPDIPARPRAPANFLLGVSSLPDSDFWKEQLVKLGARATPGRRETADFSPPGISDLLDPGRIEILSLPPVGGVSRP